jgi:hypothetical protein
LTEYFTHFYIYYKKYKNKINYFFLGFLGGGGGIGCLVAIACISSNSLFVLVLTGVNLLGGGCGGGVGVGVKVSSTTEGRVIEGSGNLKFFSMAKNQLLVCVFLICFLFLTFFN